MFKTCLKKKLVTILKLTILYKCPTFVFCIQVPLNIWNIMLGGICPPKLIKMFNIQKRCGRILFGDKYSFDLPEYYLTCAKTRKYMDHSHTTLH